MRKHMDQILGEGEGEDELWTNNSDLGHCSLEETTETFLVVYVLYNGRSGEARVRTRLNACLDYIQGTRNENG